MRAEHLDFAIFGTTTLALLLAGLLVRAHEKSVALIGQGHARYRLPRDFDLSLSPMTRPHSWDLRARLVPETARLVKKIAGREGLASVDPVFFAKSAAAREALAHMAHMAQGFGVEVEKLSPPRAGDDRMGLRWRDALHLKSVGLETALTRWLDTAGIVRLAPEHIDIAEDGAARIAGAAGVFTARQSVLIDDAAIIAHVPERQWPAILRRLTLSSLLLAPNLKPADPFMIDIDSGAVFLSWGRGGTVAIGAGEIEPALAQYGTFLGPSRPAGQIAYDALVSRDGAPAFGRAAGIGPDIVAGMRGWSAFIAPALARWLAAAPKPEEAAWFEQRLVNRPCAAPLAAEFPPFADREAS